MSKVTLVLVLAIALCTASADPIRQKHLRKQVFARQQLQPTQAPTGYAPAGVTPAVPFELPTETEQPDTVYGPPEVEDAAQQPDSVYGPPETQQPEEQAQEPDSVYGPPEAQTEQPDLIYGPPETNGNPEIDEGAAKLEPSAEVEEEEPGELDEVEEEILVDEDGSIVAISTTFDQGNAEDKPARLVYQRFPQRRQSPTAVPARFTKAKVLK